MSRTDKTFILAILAAAIAFIFFWHRRDLLAMITPVNTTGDVPDGMLPQPVGVPNPTNYQFQYRPAPPVAITFPGPNNGPGPMPDGTYKPCQSCPDQNILQ